MGEMHHSNTQQLTKSLKQQEQRIRELEASHNEQIHLINHYKQLSEEKTKFSLEVVNKSMKAVDLIRSFKEGNRKQGHKEVEEVEKQIMQCQEGIQKDLIPSNHD